MFSKACEHAIRAVIYLSAESNIDHKIGILEICEQIDAPKHFTAKILQTLTKRQIVNSRKGVNGGFFMDVKQGNRKLIDIVDAIDGDFIFTGCGLGLKECSDEEPCPLHHKLKSFRASLKKALARSSIKSVANKHVRDDSFLRVQ